MGGKHLCFIGPQVVNVVLNEFACLGWGGLLYLRVLENCFFGGPALVVRGWMFFSEQMAGIEVMTVRAAVWFLVRVIDFFNRKIKACGG